MYIAASAKAQRGGGMDSGATPKTSYLICGSPRAGTSLLSGLLDSTGVAGRPAEYFWKENEAAWFTRWRTSDYGAYVRAVMKEATTANGVFGAKVMWGYMEDVLAKLATLSGSEGLEGHALLGRWFPNLHYVWITRRDRVAQAVSWSRAIQSRRWYSGDRRHGGDRPVEFSFDQIDHLVKEIDAHELAWSEFFDRAGVSPLHVVYEALERDMKRTVVNVLGFLGIDAAGVRIEPRSKRQRDTLNDEWAKAYSRLLGNQTDRSAPR